MTASVKRLSELHAKITEAFIAIVQPRVRRTPGEDGVVHEEVILPTAAELAAAAGFLKQNNITAAPEKDESLEELRRQPAEGRKRRAPVTPDFDAELPGLQ